jgi:hypothetical protein
MARSGMRQRRLSDGYSFAGFRARPTVCDVFGDPNVRIVRLDRRSKKRLAVFAEGSSRAGTTGGCARFATCRAQDFGLFWKSKCGAVKRETGPSGGQSAFHQTLCVLCRPPLPAGIDPRCRRELRLDWDTVETLEMQYMRAQLKRAGTPVRARSILTRSRSAKATAVASWSAIWFASGRSGSAARIVPKPAWRRSTIGWARKRAVKSSSP